MNLKPRNLVVLNKTKIRTRTMTAKEKLIDSFVGGIGNTTAALVVCGFLGGMVVLGQTFYTMWMDPTSKKTQETQTNDDFNAEFEDDGFRFKRVLENLVS